MVGQRKLKEYLGVSKIYNHLTLPKTNSYTSPMKEFTEDFQFLYTYDIVFIWYYIQNVKGRIWAIGFIAIIKPTNRRLIGKCICDILFIGKVDYCELNRFYITQNI